MTQTSTDYVTWMMAEPREGFRRRLNQEWKPACGDIVLDSDASQGLGTVWQVHPEFLATPATVTAVIHGKDRVIEGLLEDWQWLPSLSDLLDLIWETIEEKLATLEDPYQCYVILNRRSRDGRGWAGEAWDGACGYGANASLDPRVAAAELLAKLWEVE